MSKSQVVKISKININIGDKEISLSPEQANELHAVLGQLLGKPETVNQPVYIPNPIYVRPYCYNEYWYWPHWSVTAGSKLGSGGSFQSHTSNYTVSLLTD